MTVYENRVRRRYLRKMQIADVVMVGAIIALIIVIHAVIGIIEGV